MSDGRFHHPPLEHNIQQFDLVQSHATPAPFRGAVPKVLSAVISFQAGVSRSTRRLKVDAVVVGSYVSTHCSADDTTWRSLTRMDDVNQIGTQRLLARGRARL